MMHQRNQWLHPGQGLTGSIDATITINDTRSLRSWNQLIHPGHTFNGTFDAPNRINDTRSLWSWRIKRTSKSVAQRGFMSSLDAQWSEWSYSIDPDLALNTVHLSLQRPKRNCSNITFRFSNLSSILPLEDCYIFALLWSSLERLPGLAEKIIYKQ